MNPRILNPGVLLSAKSPRARAPQEPAQAVPGFSSPAPSDPARHGQPDAYLMPENDVSQLRDLRATGRDILSLPGDTMSPLGYTSTLLPDGHHAGHETYLDCVSGNRSDSGTRIAPAVWAAPDGIPLRPRVSGAPRAVLFGCPLRAPSNSKRLLRWLRPVLFPRTDRSNGMTEEPPSDDPLLWVRFTL